jgi:hypothetical protein
VKPVAEDLKVVWQGSDLKPSESLYTGTSHHTRQPADPDQGASQHGVVSLITPGALQNAARSSELFRLARQIVEVDPGRHFGADRIGLHGSLLHDGYCMPFNCHHHTPVAAIGHQGKPLSCRVWNP